MRTRTIIEHDGTRKDILALEVLLDIRDLMVKERKQTRSKRKNKKEVCEK